MMRLLRAQPVHGDYPASVATTWSLNVEQVRAAEHGAEQLLRQMALLAPDAIPEELLAALLDEQEGPGRPLDDLLAPLLRYSLVRREPASRTLSLHRLLQALLDRAEEVVANDTQRKVSARDWKRFVEILDSGEVAPALAKAARKYRTKSQ